MSVLGYTSLILALVAAIYAIVASIYGGWGKHRVLIESARCSLFAVFGLVSVSVIVLLLALLTHQFQIEYVASYTSRETSLPYLISALWAGNSGSLLFWAWLLSLFSAIMALQRRSADRKLVESASPVAMFIEAFFLLLLLVVSNPFHELAFVPANGKGLNPLLENPGMIVHPPALLAGYVGLTIPFAYAVGAMLSRNLGKDWLLPARKWTLLSWLLLGAGNVIGAWWAYVELGWGGYWAWDPVENAGLMPWLAATAFLHSIMLQKRRGLFKVWNMVLIIIAFNLAIFGTFLTRSGILSSVHTFGESRLGPFFTVLLLITFFGSLILLYYRRGATPAKAEAESFVSREGTFQINTWLLIGSTFVILLGTMFPALYQAIYGSEVSLGESFFNRVNGPIFLAIILLAGICTLTGWKRTSIGDLGRRLTVPFIPAVIILVVLIAVGIREWYAVVALFLCSLVLFSIIYQWVSEVRARRRTRLESHLKAFWGLLAANRQHYGAYFVHISIVLIALGVIGSSFYGVEKEASLKPGEQMNIQNYTIRYEGMTQYEAPDKVVVRARLSVYNGEKLVSRMTPEKYFHRSYEQPVTEVAIRSSIIKDLYVILAGWDKDGSAAFRVMVNPLVSWIWIGGALLVLGGLMAFWPERKTTPAVKQASAKPVSREVDDEIEKQVRQLRQKRRADS